MKNILKVILSIVGILALTFITVVLWSDLITKHEQQLINKIANETVVKDSVICPDCGNIILINRRR